MDAEPSHPGSPAGGPLQNLSPDKVNQQQTQGGHKRSDSRSKDNSSSVHDKVSQFNNLSVSSAGRSMERKTADAALKRAMLGREEAEAETRRLRDEIKALNKTLEEGKDRERKVGERLEAVMENYGRAKETHAHTQTLWEKEIRRARKETFKSQSGAVKLQEELKAARVSAKSLEEHIKREKERSRVREQEAFEARYRIVGVQEQLDQALERIKTVEQERDAFKTAAQNEEVARIAAEGRIPLPQTQLGDEFASPPKKRISSGLKKRKINDDGGRMSLSMLEIESSAASEMEIEELTQQVLWEKNRAERAEELVEFLQAECKMRICSCGKTRKTVTVSTQSEPEEPVRRRVVEESEDHDAHDDVDDDIEPPVLRMEPEFQHKTTTPDTSMDASEHHSGDESMRPSEAPRSKKGPRHSTIFCPKEGVFRTVTEQEAMILASQKEAEIVAHRDDTVERHELKAESEQNEEEVPSSLAAE
ncbi:hypothetical protein N3K66_002527 [Trichothecium roseum]|uniref:Uncharacterized protein n=1 Tax=Trichothecium roseum TaxID=47278 RepID=A0ACC0V9T6_9HYPO|nr:hypothetical protein N3K66_002527 [Trichothecium roseum]